MEKNPNSTNQTESSQFWLGLEEYYNDPAFRLKAEQEFLSSPLREDDGKDGFARRDFLKLMGASIALATTACVRRPVQTIIPYAKAPKDVTPGEPNFYTSTWFEGNEGYGLLVKTIDGRPIKIEGNPLHPMNKGALSARVQASILSLYDPERLQGPRRNLQNKTRSNRETISGTWDAADQKITEQLKNGKVAVLTGTLPSPSSEAIIEEFVKAHGGRRYIFDTFPLDEVRAANQTSFGRSVVPYYRFDQAKMVVSVDADFLGTYLSPVEFMKQWSSVRTPGPDMARLVMFDSNMSLTGMNADDRIRIKPSQQLDVVLGLIYEVGVNLAKHPLATSARNRTFLEGYKDVAARIGMDAGLFTKVAAQLWANRGRSLVIAGGLPTQTAEATELQIAVNMLNAILENVGKTIDLDGVTYNYYQGSVGEISRLIKDIDGGQVETLIISGGINPLYTLPDAEPLRQALTKVKMIISTSNWQNETSLLADYVLPSGTQFESWGDWELQSGLFSIQQPTISPLHDTRSMEESLLKWTQASPSVSARVKGAQTWYDYVRETWKTQVFSQAGGGQSFDDFWITVLQNGVVDLSANRRTAMGSGRTFNAEALSIKPRARQEGYELVLYPTVQLADGQYANISWLQELPDPVTKIVWDNYLSVSPATAQKEKLRDGDVVTVTVGKQTLEAPVHVQAGLHDSVLSLAVGYGRKHAGKVGNDIGVNAYVLAAFAADQALFAGLPVSFKKTGKRYELASTQTHHSLEGRNHIVETPLDSFVKDGSSGIHKHHVFSIWPQHAYNRHKWALSIDLNACTGCSACVTACQSENNIPTVGKKYVMQGREMHWLRIDRYYKGTPENPESLFQPMLCQHCETAPCETVCPVLATVHNDEGLNDMVYNRCVGTRYCSNNCPYKVRRFNWFNFSKREAPLNMQLNPDVTVRTRGVMEKCTFCVQRIRHGTNAARDRKEKLKDGEIKTACQQTCPANAITFGDLNDPESAVAKLWKEPRSYAVLEELNTQPRIRYMSRVRNAERAAVSHDGHHASERANEMKKDETKEEAKHQEGHA